MTKGSTLALIFDISSFRLFLLIVFFRQPIADFGFQTTGKNYFTDKTNNWCPRRIRGINVSSFLRLKITVLIAVDLHHAKEKKFILIAIGTSTFEHLNCNLLSHLLAPTEHRMLMTWEEWYASFFLGGGGRRNTKNNAPYEEAAQTSNTI